MYLSYYCAGWRKVLLCRAVAKPGELSRWGGDRSVGSECATQPFISMNYKIITNHHRRNFHQHQPASAAKQPSSHLWTPCQSVCRGWATLHLSTCSLEWCTYLYIRSPSFSSEDIKLILVCWADDVIQFKINILVVTINPWTKKWWWWWCC